GAISPARPPRVVLLAAPLSGHGVRTPATASLVSQLSSVLGRVYAIEGRILPGKSNRVFSDKLSDFCQKIYGASCIGDPANLAGCDTPHPIAAYRLTSWLRFSDSEARYPN